MDLCLLPTPRKIKLSGGLYSAAGGSILLPDAPSAATLFSARQLQKALRQLGQGNGSCAVVDASTAAASSSCSIRPSPAPMPMNC